MSDINLKVILSQKRDDSGLLYVSDTKSGKVLGVYEALGRGSQGPGDTQLLEKGNTPTGTYSVERIEPTTNLDQNSYGPNGRLRLTPTSGNAALAGRKGLLIHGGAAVSAGSPAAAFRPVGGLKPTHGCIRLSNKDMKGLTDVLFGAALDNKAMQSRNLTVNLQVMDVPACISSPGR